MKKIKLLTPILGLTIVSNAAIATILCGCTASYKRIDFCTCDWADIADACNKLETGDWTVKRFCANFKFGDTPATNLDDFAGQKRKIMLNTHEHEVIVLGAQQDFMDANKTKPVALTFQFNNSASAKETRQPIPTIPPYSYLEVNWNTLQDDNYWNSTLNNVLNSNDSVDWKWPEDEHRSIITMIKDENANLASNIKNIYRSANVYNSDKSEYELSTRQTTLFCPCLANFFSEEGLVVGDYIKTEEQKNKYLDEGTQYQYYKNEIGNGHIEENGTGITYNCLAHPDVNNSYFPYHLSSINLNNTLMMYCSVNQRGNYETQVLEWAKLSHSTIGSTPMGGTVCPCFCI